MLEEHPAVASSLLIQGHIFSQTNMFGEGVPNLHPAVRRFVDGVASELGVTFVGTCAEVALVSDQFWGLEELSNDGGIEALEEVGKHFEGAMILSKKIRPEFHPEHGRPAEPCVVCQKLLDALGIQVVE
ncbi:YwqJ-related putative deaminase [Nocardia acidivorans]|uniref:YwqJ-related putative deaminase n=1 Tax=Nocardia acidivorans TaxID=404580 RepID=UPI00082AC86C|nr:YwqJ-related putative deaminase [Nocardia acidivorans]